MNVTFKYKLAESFRKKQFVNSGILLPEYLIQDVNTDSFTKKSKDIMFEILQFDSFNQANVVELREYSQQDPDMPSSIRQPGNYLEFPTNSLETSAIEKALERISVSRK